MSVWLSVLEWGAAAAIGAAGTLGGMLLKGELERRAERRRHRQARIGEWRAAVAEHWPLEDRMLAVPRSVGIPLCSSPAWLSLRDHLDENLRIELEGPRGRKAAMVVVHSDGGGGLRDEVLASIARAERKWGLI